MTELRGLAQKADELKNLGVQVIAISVDSQEHARGVWENIANKEFTILSDPGARVIKTYGLLHANGAGAGEDIALRTTLLVDPNGIEKWRRVSESVPDIPTIDETLTKIKETQNGEKRGVDQQH